MLTRFSITQFNNYKLNNSNQHYIDLNSKTFIARTQLIIKYILHMLSSLVSSKSNNMCCLVPLPYVLCL